MLSCAQCDKSDDGFVLMKCSGCKVTAYCSAECQKAHWGSHKRECKKLVAAAVGGGIGPVEKNPRRVEPSAASPVSVRVTSKHSLKVFHEACLVFQPLKVKICFGHALTAQEHAAVGRSFEVFKASAEGGVVEAMVNTGQMYGYGHGCEKNLPEAHRWFKLAAESGNPEGQKGLADMYRAGLVVEQNIATAKMWLEKAARQGHKGACSDLCGILCSTPLESDKVEAVSWLTQAAKANDVLACANLSALYENGAGGLRCDLQKSLQLMQKALSLVTPAEHADIIPRLQESVQRLKHAIGAGAKKALLIPVSEADKQFMEAQQLLSGQLQHKVMTKSDLSPAEKANLIKVISGFNVAAKGGHVGAIMNLAQMNLAGHGMPQDHAKAFKYAQDASSQGFPGGHKLLASLHMNGHGTERSAEKAMEYFEKGAELGDIDCCYMLGMLMRESTRVAEATPWFQKAADACHPGALEALGIACYQGMDGLKPDPKKAIEYFEKAIEQARMEGPRKQPPQVLMHIQARIDAIKSGKQQPGVDPRGVTLPTSKAHKQFIEAVQSLSPQLQRKVKTKEDLSATEKDTLAKCIAGFDVAAKEGHVGAMMNLAQMNLSGHGMPQDHAKAFKYAQDASRQGFPEGHKLLASLHLNGHGTERSAEKAMEYFEKSAELGDVDCCYMLGNLLCAASRDQEATPWLKKAAGAGHPGALDTIGIFYVQGKGGLKQDPKEALVHFEMAAKEASKDPTKNFQFIQQMVAKMDKVKANLLGFAIGSRVRIHGLQGRLELNGRGGVITNFVKETGRYTVIVDDEAKPASLKSANLRAYAAAGVNLFDVSDGATAHSTDQPEDDLPNLDDTIDVAPASLAGAAGASAAADDLKEMVQAQKKKRSTEEAAPARVVSPQQRVAEASNGRPVSVDAPVANNEHKDEDEVDLARADLDSTLVAAAGLENLRLADPGVAETSDDEYEDALDEPEP